MAELALVPPARFLLVLAIHGNLIRAAMVTRERRIVASAKQPFTVTDSAFDPAEVWYKTKKVIAACFDIGRTLAREVAGVAIVTQGGAAVIWSESGSEVIARGRMDLSADAFALDGAMGDSPMFRSDVGAWLLWNLTGAYATKDYGKTRARAPFEAEHPLVVLVREPELMGGGEATSEPEADLIVLETARLAWARIPLRAENEFVNTDGS